MIPMRTLNEAIPNWITGDGVMSVLTNNFDVPWKAVYPNPIELDIAYQGGHSGNKIVAPLPKHFIDKSTGEISPVDVKNIMGAVFATYNRKWDKLWELYMADYDPLTNYDVYEDVTEDIQSTEQKGGTVQNTSTETIDTSDTMLKTGTVENVDYDDGTERDTLKKTGTSTKETTETRNTSDSMSKTGTVNTLNEEELDTKDDTTFTPGVTKTVTEIGLVSTEHSITKTDTGSQSTVNTGTQTNANNGTKSEVDTLNLTTNKTVDTDTSNSDNIFGFNSSTASPSTSGTETVGTTEVTTETGTKSRDTTDNSSATRTDNLTATRNDNLTHNDSGTNVVDTNMGTTTTVQGHDRTTVLHTGTVTNNNTVTNNLSEILQKTGTVTTNETTTNDLNDEHTILTTHQISGKVTNNLSDVTTKTGTITDTQTTTNNLTNEDTAGRVMNGHKYGNIGVSSIQRMFKEEIENWKWTFMYEVFSDIDTMLVLAVNY